MRCHGGAVVVTWTVSAAADAGQFSVYRKEVSSTRSWVEVAVELEGQSGVYFCRLQSGKCTASKKMLLLR